MTTPDATTPERSFSAALSTLRGRQKTSKGAPAYSRLVNRPVGRVFAAAAYRIDLTPNQVTAISAMFTFSGILVIALVPTAAWSAVLVAALLVIGYALDSADGQLARLRGGGSAAGEWLDHVVDAVKIATIHTAVLIAWFRFRDARGPELLIPLAYQVVASVQFFVIILNDHLRRARKGTTEMLLDGEGRSSLLYSLAVVPTDYGLLCLAFVLMWWSWFPLLYGALMACNAGFLMLALPKWYREVRSHGH